MSRIVISHMVASLVFLFQLVSLTTACEFKANLYDPQTNVTAIAVPCNNFPDGDWGVPYFPQEVGLGGYPVGVPANMTDCMGCTASISGLQWEFPYFGWPIGAKFIVEGRVWSNWQYSQNQSRDMVRVDLRAAFPILDAATGIVTTLPQVIYEFNPVESNQTFVVRGQSQPSVWTYEETYPWPFPANETLPTQGYDELYQLFPGEPPMDSNNTLWMEIVRVPGGFNVSCAILPGFNVTGYPNVTFFVEEFTNIPSDLITLNETFSVWVMGLNNVNVQAWGLDFAGLPPPVPSDYPTATPTPVTTAAPSTTRSTSSSTSGPNKESTTTESTAKESTAKESTAKASTTKGSTTKESSTAEATTRRSSSTGVASTAKSSATTTRAGGNGEATSTAAESSSTFFPIVPPPGIFGPVMASVGGGLVAATAAAMAYYALAGGAAAPDASDIDMDIQDFPDDGMEDLSGMEDSMDGDLESQFNAENYVDVDPDNSFWRATSGDQYA